MRTYFFDNMFALANLEGAVLLKVKNIGKIYDSNDIDVESVLSKSFSSCVTSQNTIDGGSSVISVTCVLNANHKSTALFSTDTAITK